MFLKYWKRKLISHSTPCCCNTTLLSSCTSWSLSQIQLLGIVLHIPPHCGEALQFQPGCCCQNSTWQRSPSVWSHLNYKRNNINNMIHVARRGIQIHGNVFLESKRTEKKWKVLGLPVVAALTFKAKFTAKSKNSATLAKSSSTNPLDVSAGVPARSRIWK